MARVILNGESGDDYTNDTGKVLYQMIVSWQNSCGQCIELDHAVGPSWPIPFHRKCRCRQVPVYPGQTSEPFVDFRAKIEELPEAERGKVVGRSNLKLIESGVVKWEDVVTRGRIRDLHQVVAKHKLTVEDMLNAGVKKRDAIRAFGSVHTPLHDLARAQRQQLVERIRAAGASREELRQAVGEKLATRLKIGEPPPAPAPAPAPKPPPAPSGWVARIKDQMVAFFRRLGILKETPAP